MQRERKKKKEVENSKIDVRRIWNRRSIFYPFTIFKEIIKIKPDIVHTQFGPYGLEFGGFIGDYFLILLFFYFRKQALQMYLHALLSVHLPEYNHQYKPVPNYYPAYNPFLRL